MLDRNSLPWTPSLTRMRPLGPSLLIFALGCAEIHDASVTGGVTFWNRIVPLSVESAASQTAVAIGPSAPALGSVALGANLLSVVTLGLVDITYGDAQVCRVPGEPLETEYSEEIKIRRAQIERSKSYPEKTQ